MAINAAAVMAISIAAKALENWHEGEMHELAAQFQAELADPVQRPAMSKVQYAFKAAFVRAHGLIDKADASTVVDKITRKKSDKSK